MTVDMEGTSGEEEFTFADIESPFGDSGSNEPTGGEDTSSTAQQDHPEWSGMLEGLPDSFQEMLKPRLAQRDADLQRKFEENATFRKQYEPYRQIVESGINPQIVGASLQLAQQLQTNPVELYENLRDRLQREGRIQEANAVQDHIDDLEDDDEDDDGYEDPYDARLEELQRGQEAMRAHLENQQNQQIYQQEFNRATQEIQQAFQAIEQKVGRPLNAELKQRTVQEAQFLSSQQNRPVSIEEAFQSVTQFVAQTRRAAPRILPTNRGGHAQPQAKKAEDMTTEDRKAWFTEFLSNQ